MYRDGKQVITHTEHRFILSHAALGDMITSLPALIYARGGVPDEVKLTVYVPPWQVDLVRHLLRPYGEFEVCDLNDVPLQYKDRLEEWGRYIPSSMNSVASNTFTRNRVHMVDFAFHCLIDARPENAQQRSYPTRADLGPEKFTDGLRPYVVFPVGATSDNKLFKAAVMNPIIDWIAEKGYVPVFVGTKMSHTRAQMGDKLGEQLVIRDEFDKLELPSGAVDLRERTSLLELRDVLGHAAAVVGVDGGTLHLAGTTDTNIIYAMGTTTPNHRYIARNGNPNHKIRYVGPRDLECTGCQSRAVLSRWDFRLCPFGDNKCMSLLHPEDFINGLKELGI